MSRFKIRLCSKGVKFQSTRNRKLFRVLEQEKIVTLSEIEERRIGEEEQREFTYLEILADENPNWWNYLRRLRMMSV
jgi:hypothetical protein